MVYLYGNEAFAITYKTLATDYAPKAKKMAAEVEEVINQKAREGWEFVSFFVTNSCKAILMFRVPEDAEK